MSVVPGNNRRRIPCPPGALCSNYEFSNFAPRQEVHTAQTKKSFTDVAARMAAAAGWGNHHPGGGQDGGNLTLDGAGRFVQTATSLSVRAAAQTAPARPFRADQRALVAGDALCAVDALRPLRRGDDATEDAGLCPDADSSDSSVGLRSALAARVEVTG